VAQHLVLQAQSLVENRLIFLPFAMPRKLYINNLLNNLSCCSSVAPVELYFDIEAQSDLNLDYLLGVLVVDRQAKTEKFYDFVAERPEDEEFGSNFLIWFGNIPPIFHFCSYEVDAVKRL